MFLLMIVALLLIYTWPEIAIWLPQNMKM
jgi:TRAP-type C4-dicarboxylate transport system permease large subunit